KRLDLECGINRVAVRSTLEPGVITVTAACPGLKSGSIEIISHPFPVAEGYSRILPALPVAALPAAPPNWSGLETATPPMTVTAASTNAAMAGRFTESFSYTGPTELVHVEKDATNGRNIYCDRDYVFQDLPKALAGADWIQSADADRLYQSADLMQVAAAGGTTVYVAHDARLPLPDWLELQFHPTKLSLAVNGETMKIYERRLQDDESLTLGSDTDGSPRRTGDMYVVFLNRDGLSYNARR
ncbi:MAG: hypothetical protein KGR98_12105, partial [Verrucomicrobia bacterium]|nr:hypothetical protein [Verrucomicrobiota bacterium]